MKKMAALLAAMMFSLSLFGCEALDTTLPPQETQEQTAQIKSEKNTAKPQRALEQRIIEKIELAGGQIVCCAPVSVDLFELLGRQRRLFRQPCGAFLRRHGKLLLFILIDEVSISFNFKKSIVRHRK